MLTVSIESPVEHTIIAFNPAGTGAVRFGRFLHRLEGFSFEVVETDPEPERMRDALVPKVRPGVAVAGYGGDGTQYIVGHAMLDITESFRQEDQEDIYYLPFKGGRANDIWRSYTGGKSAQYILRHGIPAEARPLKVTAVTPEGLEDDDEVFGYYSYGSTAESALGLEDRKPLIRGMLQSERFRERWAARARQTPPIREIDEFKLCVSIISQFSPLTVVPDDGVKQASSGGVWATGRSMAHLGRPGVNPFRAEFKSFLAPSTNVFESARDMFRFAGGILPGVTFEGDDTDSVTIYAESGQFLTQRDGEVWRDNRLMQYPSGTTLTAEVSPRKLHTLTVPKFVPPVGTGE